MLPCFLSIPRLFENQSFRLQIFVSRKGIANPVVNGVHTLLLKSPAKPFLKEIQIDTLTKHRS